ncbi:hypothetical protein NOC27_2818 [Nitrosococcus oceani AFC27]|nr:hypothetical protein NOC27_2818 [Nitrosococcus oceani AFC27]
MADMKTNRSTLGTFSDGRSLSHNIFNGVAIPKTKDLPNSNKYFPIFLPKLYWRQTARKPPIRLYLTGKSET